MVSRRPALFTVLSWGASATTWLARVLNAHSEIFCVHQLNRMIASATGTAMDDGSYMQVIENLGMDYRLAGDCHGCHWKNVPALTERWPGRFRAAVLTRHPVPRLRSAYSLNLRRDGATSRIASRIRREAPAAAASDEQIMFFHFVTLVNNVIRQRQAGRIFRMEDVTTNPESLRELVDYLSDGTVETGDPARLGFERRTRSHTGEQQFSPRESFLAMEPWQRELFKAHFAPDARQVYEDLGYEFDFVGRE